MIIDPKNFRTRLVWILFWIILVVGVGLRLGQHFLSRPLWEDEAHLALNFIYFGYKDLTKPLENFQAAPIMFLFSVETVTRFFGYSELALRAFPFFASLLIYPLFYFYAKEVTRSRLAGILSFLFFSINISLIYIISEVKPYTLEISSYILIGYLLFSKNAFVTRRRNLLLAIGGALAIVYANTSIIILTCAAGYLIYTSGIVERDTTGSYRINRPPKSLYPLFVWAAVFLWNYYTFIHDHPYGPGMKRIWTFAFAPTTAPELTTFIKARIEDTFFADLLYISKEFYFDYVLMLILVVGILHTFYRRNTGLIFMVILPIVVQFVLSALQIYPFFFRFIFHLLPAIIIIMAVGISVIARFLWSRGYRPAVALFVTLCCFFILKASYYGYPSWPRNIKGSLDVINQQYPESKIYVTTPLTLYQFYLRTGYIKNPNYQPLDWNITPEQFYNAVKDEKANYILLHSSFGAGDGYGPILEDLVKNDLIVNKYDYKMYGIAEVKPKADMVSAQADSLSIR